MNFLKLFVGLLFISGPLAAQVPLGASITAGTLPSNADSICPIPVYIDSTGQFMSSGYQPGHLVNDFTLYTENNTPYTLSNELSAGQPLMLIAASYTCPNSRDGLANRLTSLVSLYGAQMKFLIVYVVEPHPDSPDVSPYSGQVWVTSQNVQDNVLFPQERTYGERSHMAHVMDSALLSANVPMLLDDACNSWWSHYGPAPNNAYLLLPDGHVFRKYGWFNDEHFTIELDIDYLLQTLDVPGQNENSDLQIFPNPLEESSVLQVKIPGGYQLQIHDMQGRSIAEQTKIAQEKFPLAALGLAAGTYICTITGNNGEVRLHRKFAVR